jgi:hypothetical protein
MAVLIASALTPATADAASATGPRETMSLSFTSVLPNAPTGYRFKATFRHPTDPSADPPALRGMNFAGPPGGRVDTSVAPQCTASDATLRLQGDAACPPGSRIGGGTITMATSFGRMNGTLTAFNGSGQEIDLVQFNGFVGGVARFFYGTNGYTSDTPTCFAGGQPPSGCPFDQAKIITTAQIVPAVAAGSGPNRRGIITNPPACPKSGVWPSRYSLRFADGARDELILRHLCTRPGLKVRRRRCVTAARVTGRDLREVSSVIFYVDGRRVARDRTAPYRLRRRLSAGRRHRVGALVRAHGVTVSKLRRYVRRCG